LHLEELEERTVPTTWTQTTSGIYVLEDQLPSLDSALTQFMATHTVGTQKQTLAQVDAFRAYNPNYLMLEYQLGTGNSPYDYIINNQWASDWTYVNSQESFFAHQNYSGEPQSSSDLSSGRVGNSSGWEQADIANPIWQQYTIGQVEQNIAATGADGWFADSFTYGFGGAGYDGTIPTRYQGTNAIDSARWPGGVTWDQQLGNWVNAVESAFASYNTAHGTNLKFIPNLDNLTTGWMPTSWYQNVDGAFLESFADIGGGIYDDPSAADWVLSMNRGLALSSAGKIVIVQPYLDYDSSGNLASAASIQQREYVLGSYLLLQGQYTYINMGGGGVEPYYFPEYQLNLGQATTALASNVSSYLWNGVYRRNFQNGFVLVNPNGTSSGTLSLGGTYQEVTPSGGGIVTDAAVDASGNYIGGSLTYQNVSSTNLAPGTAAIFMNTTSSPTVTGVSPRAGPTAGGTSVTITGTNFTGATGVKFGTVAATNVTVNSATSITATDPAGSGTVDVTVTTPGGTSATSAADHFTYQAAPTVTSVSPSAGPTAGGTSVTITGTNFTGTTGVKFGTVAATNVTVNSATSITATDPAGSGTVDVTVTTPGGTSATGTADHFTYVATPTITSVGPNSGFTAGGTSVTITGTNFVAGATVSFGGTAGTSVVVNSTTQITVTAPAHTSTTVDITVTTAGGATATSAADHFTYLDFADNFNQGNGPLSSGWSIPSSFAPKGMRFQYRRQVKDPVGFQVSTNAAVGQGTSSSSVAAEQVAGQSLLNPTVQADVTLGTATAVGLFARSQSNGDAYVAVLISGKAQIWLYHGATGAISVLGSANYTATPPTTIKFTVAGSGASTTLSLTDGAGNPLLPAVTGSPLTTLNSAGGVGIFAQGVGGTVDNFSVSGS
jgi:hypothetical protein